MICFLFVIFLEIVLRVPFLVLGLSMFSTVSWADFDAEVGLEARYFFEEGLSDTVAVFKEVYGVLDPRIRFN